MTKPSWKSLRCLGVKDAGVKKFVSTRIVSFLKSAPVLFLLFLLPGTAKAQTYFNYNDIQYGTYNSTICYVNCYLGNGGSVSIPSSAFFTNVIFDNYNYIYITNISKLNVVSIGSAAFGITPGLTSVTIPNSITNIGDHAFNDTGLTSVIIPNSVTSIGEMAFGDCPNLASVTIPNSVKNIGEHAFQACTKLTSVIIPNSVASISDGTFMGCSNLTSVTIPYGVTSIEGWAFQSCTSLAGITIPGSVKNIGEGAFNSSGLTAISIPNSVTGISDWTFEDCSKLTSVTIPNSVTSIGNYAFIRCSSLPSITIGLTGNLFSDSARRIGDYAFSDCSSLAKVTLEGVAHIGEGAFEDCYSLTSVTVPKTVESIGDFAFYSCFSLTNASLPEGIGRIGVDTFGWCCSLPNVTVPLGTTIIDDSAFEYCSSLTKVTIPVGVRSIGNSAFYGCSKLTKITLYYTITSIGSWAFSDCSSLTNVTCSGYPPKPTNDISVFSGTPPNLIIYYYYGITGWDKLPNGLFDGCPTKAIGGPNPKPPPKPYQVTVKSNTTKGGTVVGGGAVVNGDQTQIMAIANPGYRFLKWNDGNTDNPRTITPTKSGTYTATFVTVYYFVAGTFSGLFQGAVTNAVNTGDFDPTNTGLLKLTLNASGTFSGKLTTMNRAIGISGKMSLDTRDTNLIHIPITITKNPAISGDVSISLTNTNVITGHLAGALFIADYYGQKALNYKVNPNKGLYNFITEQYDPIYVTNGPIGDSLGRATVKSPNATSITLKLADQGATATVGTLETMYGNIPVFAPLYAKKGLFIGWLTLSGNDMTSDTVFWYKGTNASKVFYPSGFLQTLFAVGGRFTPAKTLTALTEGMASGTLSVWDGFDLNDSVNFGINKNACKPEINTASFKVSPSTGLLTGKYIPTGSKTSFSLSGIYIPPVPSFGLNAPYVFGFLLETNLSGTSMVRFGTQ